MGKKARYYVVWSGNVPGIYLTWGECKEQVHGVVGARYKSFDTQEDAEEALKKGPEPLTHHSKFPTKPIVPEEITENAWAVDAACSGNPGQMEYRGVDLLSHRQIFHVGPMFGTNNIGEFLAIVHAVALLTQRGITKPVYSDSRNAILWFKTRKCRTKLPLNEKTQPIYQLIKRAEDWLQTHTYNIPVIKWPTDKWGEIPADFGRK